MGRRRREAERRARMNRPNYKRQAAVATVLMLGGLALAATSLRWWGLIPMFVATLITANLMRARKAYRTGRWFDEDA
ncbi:hypothetical protein ACQP00_31120 [Dactylosporangium sp. CS-047395]|uniref:hypothetical protein n=1 Tax=Dactylosporangium sp. CS-047395 TaxID=3239936 RepID=UPI003D903E1F